LVIVGPGGAGELDEQGNRAACVAVLDKLLKKNEADTNYTSPATTTGRPRWSGTTTSRRGR
jgi:hypothetical protein